MKSKTLISLSIIAILAGVAYYWFALAVPPAAAPTTTLPTAASGQSNSSTIAPPKPRPPSPVAPSVAPSPSQPLVKSQRARDFESATDLSVFVSMLAKAAGAGDGEAARLIAQAYDECVPLRAQKPGSNLYETIRKRALTLDEPERTIALQHNDVRNRRCAELARSSQLNRESIASLNASARKAGELAALADGVMTQGDQLPEQDVKDALRRIVSSRNGDAIGVMAYSMGDGRVDERDIYGPFSGSQDDFFAWLLVACDLGRDCSQSGALMRNLCVNINHCYASDYREYIRRVMATPEQFSSATRKRDALLRLIATDSISEIFP